MSSSSNSKRSLTFIVVACRRKSSPSAFQHTHTRTEREKEKEKEREDRRDGAFVISAMPIPRSLAAKKKRRPPGSVKKTTSSSTPPQREEEVRRGRRKKKINDADSLLRLLRLPLPLLLRDRSHRLLHTRRG